jgi:y4mF family transcriptional regulator
MVNMDGMKEQSIQSETPAELDRHVPEITSEELGPALHYHRRKAGLTQAELAKLAGVGKTVIFDIEKGKASVQLDTLLKVLHALNVTMLFQSPLMEKYLLERHAKR